VLKSLTQGNFSKIYAMAQIWIETITQITNFSYLLGKYRVTTFYYFSLFTTFFQAQNTNNKYCKIGSEIKILLLTTTDFKILANPYV
jgi:hypothetical protein